MTQSCIRSAILLRVYFGGLSSTEVVLLALLNSLIPFLPLSLLYLSPSPFNGAP
jgi:hypothetical protein